MSKMKVNKNGILNDVTVTPTPTLTLCVRQPSIDHCSQKTLDVFSRVSTTVYAREGCMLAYYDGDC
jgi:hypothetical protein